MSLSPYTGKDNVTRKHGGEHKADVAAIDGEDAPPSVGEKAGKERVVMAVVVAVVAVVVAAVAVVASKGKATKIGSSNLVDVARRQEWTFDGINTRSIENSRRMKRRNSFSGERSRSRMRSRMHQLLMRKLLPL